MRQIVHQPGGDAAEHRLPFLLADVFLELDEPVGHRVERVAQLVDLVAAADRDPLVHLAGGNRPRGVRQGEDPGDERARPDPAEHDRAEQGDARSRA